MRSSLCFVLACLALSAHSALSAPIPDLPDGTDGTIRVIQTHLSGRDSLDWQTDYQGAILDAVNHSKCLAVFFQPDAEDASLRAAATRMFARKDVRAALADMVCVRVPQTASHGMGTGAVVLLKHSSFRAMEGRPGLAVLDLRDAQSPRYGTVVAAWPMKPKVGWDASATATWATSLRWLQAPTLEAEPASATTTGATGGTVSPITHIESARPRITAGGMPAPTPDALPQPNAALKPDSKPGVTPPLQRIAGSRAAPSAAPSPDQPVPPLAWETDYAQAVKLATERGAMLVLFFPSPSDPRLGRRFEEGVLAQPEVRRLLADCVCAKLPLDAKATIDGRPTTLLTHESLREMLAQPGLAMIDLGHKDSKWYGQVVSVFPFLDGQPHSVEHVLAMLRLPEGSLTQRTMIYAVAIHPEHPASIAGRVDVNLLHEAESHSEHQAQIQRQGHHNWSSRFARINDVLGDGMLAREVCAESWPGQSLVESAIECVRCWRLSSGHWGAVSGRQDAFGYDIKRGENGIWYATGIFGSR